MSSLIITQAQNNIAGFATALRLGKITQAQYTQAVGVENQKIAAENARLSAQKAQQQATQPSITAGSSMGLGYSLSQAAQNTAPTPNQESAPTDLPVPGLANQILETKKPSQAVPSIGTNQALSGGILGSNANVFGATVNPITNTAPIIDTQEKADLATIAVTGAIAPVVVATSIVAGEVANVGVQSAVKSIESGKAQLVLPSSPEEVLRVASDSALLGFVGGELASGITSGLGEAATPVVKAGVNVGVNAGLSGGVSGLTTGGDPKAILEGAAFGAGLGAVGEGIGATVGRVAKIPAIENSIQNIKDVTVGSKFTEIKSIDEVSIQATKGDTTLIERITQPNLETVTLKGETAKFYRDNNIGNFEDVKLNLKGTETQSVTLNEGGLPSGVTTIREVESTRIAQPILDTLGGADFKMAKQGTGQLGDMVNLPPESFQTPIISESGRVKGPADLFAASDTILKPVQGKVFDSAGRDQPVLVLEKKVVSIGESGLPDLITTKRSFTDVSVTGKLKEPAFKLEDIVAKDDTAITKGGMKGFGDETKSITSSLDRQFEAGQIKAHEDISLGDYKKMTKDSKAMKAGSNDDFRKSILKEDDMFNPEGRGVASGEASGEGKLVLDQAAKSEAKSSGKVSLDRAILGEVKAGAGLKVPTVPVIIQKDNTQTGGKESYTLPSMGNIDVGQTGQGRMKIPTIPQEGSQRNPISVQPIIDMPTATEPVMTANPIVGTSPISQPTMPAMPPTILEPPSITDEPSRIIVDPIIYNPGKQPTENVMPMPIFNPVVPSPSRRDPIQPVEPIGGIVIDPIQDFTPVIEPKQPQKFNPITEPTITPITVPELMPKQKNPIDQTPAIAFKMPSMPKTRTRNTFNLPAGGFGAPRAKGAKSGAWFQKKHKVKTYGQMLKSVGVGIGSSKGASTGLNMKQLGGLGNIKQFTPKGLSGKSLAFSPTFSSKKMFKGGMGNMGGLGNFKAASFKLPQQPKKRRRR